MMPSPARSQENHKTSGKPDPEAFEMRRDLEGWSLQPSSPEDIRAALEKALDYRGDVTITLTDGERFEGYIFDRKITGPCLTQCFVRMIPREGNEKISIRYSDVVRLEFTGRDTAAGRRFELWLQSYREKRTSGKKDTPSSAKLPE